MAVECKRYHSRLAGLIATKKGESYATTMSWIRARVLVFFALLRLGVFYLRGSRASKGVQLILSDLLNRNKMKNTLNTRQNDFYLDNVSAGMV